MNILKYGFLFLCNVILLTSCINKEDVNYDNIKIGVCYASEKDEYSKVYSDMHLSLNKYNWKVFERVANGNISIQQAHVQNFIRERVDFIIVDPIRKDGWNDILNYAKISGVPVLFFNNSIGDSYDENLFLSVGYNNFKEGKDCVKALEKYFKKNSFSFKQINFIVIHSDNNFSADYDKYCGIMAEADNINWFNFCGRTKQIEDVLPMLKSHFIPVFFVLNESKTKDVIRLIENSENERTYFIVNAGAGKEIKYKLGTAGLTSAIVEKYSIGDAVCSQIINALESRTMRKDLILEHEVITMEEN